MAVAFLLSAGAPVVLNEPLHHAAVGTTPRDTTPSDGHRLPPLNPTRGNHSPPRSNGSSELALGDWPGPHDVKTKKTWSYNGPCSPGTVYYPDSEGQFPLLSFAHGLGASGTSTTYGYTVKAVASWGYIVVALEGCEAATNEQDGQQKIMDWMFDNWDTIDRGRPGGVYGHSMGGAATDATASDGSACVRYGLQGAVMMHPGVQLGMGSPWIPSMFLAGENDHVVGSIPKRCFDSAAKNGVARAFGSFNGYSHVSPCGPVYNKEVMDIANWFGCFLYYNQDSCGTLADSFCNGDKAASCQLIWGEGASSGGTAWSDAIATGDPTDALRVPWGLHNGTLEGMVEEVRRRGQWAVQQRREYLRGRTAVLAAPTPDNTRVVRRSGAPSLTVDAVSNVSSPLGDVPGSNWPAQALGDGGCGDANGNPATEYVCYETGAGGAGTTLGDCQAIGAQEFSAFAMGFTFGPSLCQSAATGAHLPCCMFWAVTGAALPSIGNCQAFPPFNGGLITQAIGRIGGTRIGGTCYSALVPPKPPAPDPDGPLPVCEKGWPTFASAGELASHKKWSGYFTDLYGGAPPKSMFPLDTSSWWMLYAKLIDAHGLQARVPAALQPLPPRPCAPPEPDPDPPPPPQLPKSAGKCAPARCQLNHYGENNSPPSQWIWHPPPHEKGKFLPYPDFAAGTWVEVMREEDPFGDEHYGAWCASPLLSRAPASASPSVPRRSDATLPPPSPGTCTPRGAASGTTSARASPSRSTPTPSPTLACATTRRCAARRRPPGWTRSSSARTTTTQTTRATRRAATRT